MAKKMSGRLVALSASAVATIYVAGLLSTQPAAQSVAQAAAAQPAATSASTSTGAAAAPSVVVGASASATAPATATPTSAPVAPPTTASTSSTATTYWDGTYSATGTSALGNVTVSVTIANDKITNVQITKVTTKFPMSRIASLPAQVVQAQSATVNVVSGATYSSQAFKQAVQAALSQARAANTQGVSN